ncbi:MAG: glycosyltransferase family 4 protein [Pseudomonadota bacterium]
MGDLAATRFTRRLIATLDADIVHGHGAKGGAYARLAADTAARRAYYTPHGGALHYAPTSLQGRVFMALEQRLARTTSGLIFESAFSRDVYRRQVGSNGVAQRVIPNGLLDAEFVPHAPEPDAADFLFIGELRWLKGVDVLLNALAQRAERYPNRPCRTLIVGDGPDRAAFEALTSELKLEASVTFTGAQPAQDMFDRARCLVMPSRAESFPYVILETAARGMPMISTDVGGIPEITGPTPVRLIAPDQSGALCDALVSFLDTPQDFSAAASHLQERTRTLFSVDVMTDSVLDFYARAEKQQAA